MTTTAPDQSDRSTVPLRLTITIDYTGDPEDYGTDDPELMSVLDSEQLPEHLYVILNLMDKYSFTLEVEPR